MVKFSLWTKRLWDPMSLQSVIHQVMSGNINFSYQVCENGVGIRKKTIFSIFSKTSVLEDRVHITILSSVKQSEHKL